MNGYAESELKPEALEELGRLRQLVSVDGQC